MKALLTFPTAIYPEIKKVKLEELCACIINHNFADFQGVECGKV